MVDKSMTRDPVVKFLLEKLDEVSVLPSIAPSKSFLSYHTPCV